MTSVQNRLLPLSGNKWLLFAVIGLLLAACSPKLRPVVTVPVKSPADTVPVKNKSIQVTIKPPAPLPVPVISLLLPFNLDELDLSKGTRANLNKADLAMEYYQGFKLALDSLTANNNNFKLQVFDTKDAAMQIRSLALNSKVRASAIIIGPVYPGQIKSFTAAAPDIKKMLVSPLSPASPADYKNPNLVTIIPPLEYHCWDAAAYIQGKLKGKKVFILRSGYSEENKYILPFKKAIDSLGKKRIKVVEFTVMRGNISLLLPQLSKTEQNIFIIPSINQAFLQVTLRSLEMLLKQYPVTVFGHPNWQDFIFLKPELLQQLNTFITTSNKVDYHAAATIKFLKDYRNAYHAEPGEYAIKGYDEGLYFGQLTAPGQTISNFGDYRGLHNTFHLVNKPGAGYVNTHVQLYRYVDFELKPVE